MQFFNSNSNPAEFHRQSLSLLAEAKLELNEKQIELILKKLP